MQRVKLKTLLTRINRRLAKDHERLCKARPYEVRTLGDYYLLDCHHNTICRCRIEPSAFAAERGILLPGEVVEQDEVAAIAAVEAAPACRWPKAGKS